MTVAFRRTFSARSLVGVSALCVGVMLSSSALPGRAKAQVAPAQPAPTTAPTPAARVAPAAPATPAAPAATPARPAAPTIARPAPKKAAPAADTAGEPAGYTQVMDEAVAEYDLRHFAEARSLFSRGLSMFPNARAFRGLGMTEFELRNYGDSIANLELALASTVKPLDGELRAETQRLLDRARGFVGKLSLSLEPSGTTVLVDGAPVLVGSQGNLVIEVGDHVLEFRADGYRPETRNVKVTGGENESLHVVLSKDAQPQPQIDLTTTAVPPNDDRDGRRPLYKNPWLWAGIGVGVAALATGLALGLSGDDSGDRSARVGTLSGP